MEQYNLDLELWNYLDLDWQKAKESAVEGQADLDFKMLTYLTSGGISPAPSLQEQENIDELWFYAAEKRNKMNEFISERFG